MSVKDFDFNEAFKKSAGLKTDTKPVADKKGTTKEEPKSDDFNFKEAFVSSVKKKEPSTADLPKDAKTLPPVALAPTLASDDPANNDTFKTPFAEINKKSGILTPEEAAIAQENNTKGFGEGDKEKLSSLLSKHKIGVDPLETMRTNLQLPQIPKLESEKQSLRPFVQEYDNAIALENNIRNKIAEQRKKYEDRDIDISEANKIEAGSELFQDLQEAENLRKKVYREITIEGENKIDAIVRTDQSGNLLKKTFNRLMATSPSNAVFGQAAISLEAQDKINKLPSQFVTGLNYLKGIEPVIYERISDALAKGLPISESQIATITAQGLDIEEERLKRNIAQSTKEVAPETARFNELNSALEGTKKIIDTYEQKAKDLSLTVSEIEDYKNKVNEYNTNLAEIKPLQEKLSSVNNQFAKKAQELYDVKTKNLLDNEETIRAFLADGIAEKGDMIGKIKNPDGIIPANTIANYLFGHTWNYSDNEIKNLGEQYAKENNLDPTDPRIQKALKYLQDNEGVMVMENSIAKAGGIREFFKGAAEPIRGTFASIEDLGKSSNDVYTEAHSLGNTNVSEKRLKEEETGVRGVMNEVLKGSGQFLTQAGMMYGTGELVGSAAKGILGRAGVAALEGNIALADMGIKDIAGKLLLKGKNPVAVFTSSYAMAYDNNLKQALNYTSDNSLAKKAAAFNSGLEGATELFLSPLDIAGSIIKKFTKGQTKDLLKIMSDKSLKNDPSALKAYATKFVKGILGTAKVAGAEIGEELVTQISDYATNAYLNPNSEAFKNRNLLEELGTTAYQTGLTMAIPALLNGIGSARANTFAKGSLLVAAQNRQKMIDSLKDDLANNRISQNEFNAKASLINTAAQANAELPNKADGTKLNTDEKTNYIFSRVTEAMMQNKVSTIKDEAEKQIWAKKIKEQQNYRAAILGNEVIEEKPSYKVDGNEVSRPDFLRIAQSEGSDKYDFEVTGDEQTQQLLRDIGGIDEKVIAPKENNEELIATLKGKPEIPSFEYDAMLANPDLALREIADQTLGLTRNGEERVVNEFGPQEEQTRKKYGDAVVDRAIELYPDERIEANRKLSELVPELGGEKEIEESLKGLRDDDFAKKYFNTTEYKAWSEAEITDPTAAKQMIADKKESLKLPTNTEASKVTDVVVDKIPFEERTDEQHATYIKDKFVQEFTKKGVPKEQVDAAVALMDARAKVNGGDSWYRQIEDVGNGKFKDDSKEILFQVLDDINVFESNDPVSAKSFISKVFSTVENADDAKSAYKKLAVKYHPDKNQSASSTSIFQHLNTEYENYSKRGNKGSGDYGDFTTSGKYQEDLFRKKQDEQKKKQFVSDFSELQNRQKRERDLLKQTQENKQKVFDEKESPIKKGYEEYETAYKKKPMSVEGMSEYRKITNEYLRESEERKRLFNIELSKEAANLAEKHKKELNDFSNQSKKFQDDNGVKRGALETLANGRKIIHALDAPDFSTTVHEIAHVFEGEISQAERNVIQDWAGTKVWNTKTSETFARGFERYLRDGNAPTEALKTIFQKAKEWLQEIYQKLKGSPIEKRITPEVKEVFDNLFKENKSNNKEVNEKETAQPPKSKLSKFKEKYLASKESVNLPDKTDNNEELTKQLPDTLSPTEKQGSLAGGEANAAATIITGKVFEANEAAKRGGKGLLPEKLKLYEEKQLKDYAESNNLLLEDNFGEPHANGMEQDVYMNPDGKTVTKIHSNITHDTWNELFQRIAIHNTLFPDVAYTLKGFTTHEGQFSAVFEQPLITKAEGRIKYSEVIDELSKLGFEPSPTNEVKYGEDLSTLNESETAISFINDKTGVKISDLHGENVIKGTDGKLHFIDPIVTKVNQVEEKTNIQETAEKNAALEKEKQQKINEVTKPQIDFGLGITNIDLINTSAQNRHEFDDIKSKLASLKNIINCLWT